MSGGIKMLVTQEELNKIMRVDKMVDYLKEKNIKFEKISEEEAELYLRYNNNYYNVIAFRRNFLKYPSPAGKFDGKYIDLDFAYLKDLAIIDYRVRLVLFKIIMNI